MNQQSPLAVIERLHDAMNRHDLDAFQACFSPDFKSEQPIHPDRTFFGNEQVRKNWTRMFEGIPDFQGDLMRTAVNGNTTWSEWLWHGTRTDGAPFQVAAAILFHVENDRIVWGGCIWNLSRIMALALMCS